MTTPACTTRSPTPSAPGSLTQAIAEGIEPTSAAADTIVTELAGEYAKVFGRPDDSELRHWLLHRLNVANDPEVERYWKLLSEINSWPIPDSIAPVFEWFIKAVQAQIARQATPQAR
ncbi:MAG: hypothetical protein HOV87_02125 [Catenulispora sp.]|nr:hypothetical protein [Catenulispora sp.]